LRRSESLKGSTVLITAGPTREYLDPVRFLSNRSSGKMGYELAREALGRGARVILISGPSSLFPPAGAEMKKVETAKEMEKEVLDCFPRAEIIIMAAAVSDFRFAETFSRKLKKQALPEEIRLERTDDILAALGRKKKGKILAGFAAETDNVVENAIKKAREKKLDLIVANDVTQEGIGFESDFNRVSIIDARGGVQETEKLSKREISRIILDKIEEIRGKKAGRVP
jgi:phosphopantothenoylcysteine decarboxylase/phosphopantothenate--cysteine ligase